MRVAFSSIVSNTGCKSPGDLEMTSSTSLVAVCCSSDSQIVGALPQLVEQPRVLDGDDRLGGEVLDQLDLLVGERPDFLAVDDDRADRAPLLQHRHDEKRPVPPSSTAVTAWGIPSISASSVHTSTIWTACFVPQRAPDGVSVPVRCGTRLRCLNERRWLLQRGGHGSSSPSMRYRIPKLAWQMRVAFSSMASNTDSWSPGELADDLQHLRGRGLLLERLADRRCAGAAH